MPGEASHGDGPGLCLLSDRVSPRDCAASVFVGACVYPVNHFLHRQNFWALIRSYLSPIHEGLEYWMRLIKALLGGNGVDIF